MSDLLSIGASGLRAYQTALTRVSDNIANAATPGYKAKDIDEATTIAGLVIHEAKAIPEVGQRFRIAGIEAEVLRRHRNRVTKLRLSPIGDRAQTGALHDAGRP